jgi:hypothetical protein
MAGMTQGWLFELGILLLAVNYFNLLPVLPLDGGQLLKALIPSRQFNLLIALEWLGVAALLYLAWTIDSLFVAALALLPLFGGLALIKRKQVLAALEQKAPGASQKPLTEQITSIIQAIDDTDKRYRPLMRKLQEIDDILTAQRLKPVAPAVAGAFLFVYVTSFLLPPVAVYATSPMIRETAKILLYDTDSVMRDAYDRAIKLPLAQLVDELADSNRRLIRRIRPELDSGILSPPAAHEAIAETEWRLGFRLPDVHREFFAISNGFAHIVTGAETTDYLLYPVEQVDFFKHKQPQLLAKLRENTDLQYDPITIYRYSEFADEESEQGILDLERLGDMLVIGSRYKGEYLLLESPSQTPSATPVLLISDTLSGLHCRGFAGLRDYLSHNLSLLQMADPLQTQ